MLETPIIFIIFNRPDTTRRVFETIRAARPARLLVVADGPRADREGEAERCAAARAIVEEIDWPCEVQHNYSEANLGCRIRVATGITWAFEQVEEAIILEDDTVPHPSFFRYCAELLDRYRDEERVMCVSGNNFQNGIQRGEASYYFSKYNHCWGWATWRRAWRHFDVEMDGWCEYRESELFQQLNPDDRERDFWQSTFDKVAEGKIDAWSYAWTLACWKMAGLTALPNVNLVSNIGFGEDATHTGNVNSPLNNIPTVDIGDIRHPPTISQDIEADKLTLTTNFMPAPRPPHITRRCLSTIRHAVPQPIKQYVRRVRGSASPGDPPWDRLRALPRYCGGSVKIAGKTVRYVDAASCASAGQAIFTDEIYKFSCSNPQPRIIDCGANIGLAILYWKTCFPDALITAFEPDPKIYEILAENIVQWGEDDIDLVNCALGLEDGYANFEIEGADAGFIANGSSTRKSTIRSTGTIRVPVKLLSHWLNKRVDLLKIDIEGAECAVIEEIAEYLINVDRLFVEWHSIAGEPQHLDTILRILRENGFRVHLQPEYFVRSPFTSMKTSSGMDNRVNMFATKNNLV